MADQSTQETVSYFPVSGQKVQTSKVGDAQKRMPNGTPILSHRSLLLLKRLNPNMGANGTNFRGEGQSRVVQPGGRGGTAAKKLSTRMGKKSKIYPTPGRGHRGAGGATTRIEA